MSIQDEVAASDRVLLSVALRAAVPLWVERVRGYPESVRKHRAEECASVVAEMGDLICFRSPGKNTGKAPGSMRTGPNGLPLGRYGSTAHAFNCLAEGLALLALNHGSVEFAGLHFEASR